MAIGFMIKEPENGCQVIGIKRAPSKDGKRTYTTYFTVAKWSEYELNRGDYGLEGLPVKEYQTTEDFPIHVGDVVRFYFDQAIGDYQPLVDFKMIQSAVDAAKSTSSGSKG